MTIIQPMPRYCSWPSRSGIQPSRRWFWRTERRPSITFRTLKKQGESAPCDLVLLDLNLPRVNGFEVLAFLKGDAELKKIPVVVLSGSSSQQDIERCYASGANSYFCKPVGIDEVFSMAAQLVSYWFNSVLRPGNAKGFGTI